MKKDSVFVFKPYSEGIKYGIGSYINALTEFEQSKFTFHIVELFFPETKNIEYIQGTSNITIKIPFSDAYKIVNGCTTDIDTCKSIWDIISVYINYKHGHIFHFNTPFLLNLIKLIIDDCQEHKVIYTFHKLRWKYYFNCSYDAFNNIMEQKINNGYLNFVRLTLSEEKKICSLSHSVIVLTNEAKKYVVNEYGVTNKNVFLIRNGLKIEEYESAVDIIKTNKKYFAFLFVGRLCEEKGLSYLLEAFNEFAMTNVNVKLFIAGDGETPNLKFKNKDKMVFLGQISQARLQNLYRECDIGIIPSLNEECSYVAMEMATNKIPIICSDIGGLNEMFSHGFDCLKIGHYYDENHILKLNIGDFLSNMELLYQNKELRNKLMENAYIKVKTNHSIETMVNNTLELYEKS